jgi:fermentation-respiration switch protein FrsA (DUF1100 family)
MIFPGRFLSGPQEAGRGVRGLERLWLDTSSGRVEAWLILPPVEARSGQEGGRVPAVIFTHGNAELIDYWPELLGELGEMGVALLLVEYPGYGRSEGSPSQKSITETMLLAYDTLVARPEVDSGRIVVHGRSVGSGAACILLGRRKVAAAILESSFTGIRPFARERLLPPFLVLDPFDNLQAVRDFQGPVLVIHGKRDDVIPYRHGKKLAEAAGARGMLVTYDCAHNDCPPDRRRFWRDIRVFFQENGILPAAKPPLPEPASPPTTANEP